MSLAIDNATAEKDEKSGAKDRAEHIQKNKVQYIKKIKQMLLNQEFKAKSTEQIFSTTILHINTGSF